MPSPEHDGPRINRGPSCVCALMTRFRQMHGAMVGVHIKADLSNAMKDLITIRDAARHGQAAPQPLRPR